MACNAIDGLQQAGFPEYLFDLIGEVLPDLVLALIDSLPGNFITPAHEPVIGTQHSVVRFRFVPELFDQEIRAAVRAFRLNNDIGNIRTHPAALAENEGRSNVAFMPARPLNPARRDSSLRVCG
jgi:hypothetical protein